jgi:hypothetical protein
MGIRLQGVAMTKDGCIVDLCAASNSEIFRALERNLLLFDIRFTFYGATRKRIPKVM